MTSSAAQRDALIPRGADRITGGLMLAVLVHLGLVVAIAIGVNWRSRAPEAMSAELWSAVPQAAAPRLEEPEPPKAEPRPKPVPQPAPVVKAPPPVRETPDADIAIEKAKREKELKRQQDEDRQQEEARKQAEARKLQQQRQEQQRAADDAAALKKQQELDRQKKLADAKREAETQKAEAALRDQASKSQARIMAMAGATGDANATGTAKQNSGPSSNYAGLVQNRLQPYIVYTEDSSSNPVAEFEVRAAPDGTILGTPRLTKSSGVPGWDDAALRAIIKAGVLPRDTNGTVPPLLTIALRPKR